MRGVAVTLAGLMIAVAIGVAQARHAGVSWQVLGAVLGVALAIGGAVAIGFWIADRRLTRENERRGREAMEKLEQERARRPRFPYRSS